MLDDVGTSLISVKRRPDDTSFGLVINEACRNMLRSRATLLALRLRTECSVTVAAHGVARASG